MQHLLPKLKEEFQTKSEAARQLNAKLLKELREEVLVVTSDEYKKRRSETNGLIQEVKELRRLIKSLESKSK